VVKEGAVAIQEGNTATAFTLPDSNGNKVALKVYPFTGHSALMGKRDRL